MGREHVRLDEPGPVDVARDVLKVAVYPVLGRLGETLQEGRPQLTGNTSSKFPGLGYSAIPHNRASSGITSAYFVCCDSVGCL